MAKYNFLPPSRPSASKERIWDISDRINYDQNKYPAVLVLLRGYYDESMGGRGNDRMMYDDAGFFLNKKTGEFFSFNVNCDPGAFRSGIATLRALKPGQNPYYYKRGIHGLSKPKILQYEALVQAGPVWVDRDGGKSESGFFGINFHRGGFVKVSSLGCQTVYPLQWAKTIERIFKSLPGNHNQIIPMILMEEAG